ARLSLNPGAERRMSLIHQAVVPTVEAYARKYPGVPREVILKEDLLRRGMTFTDTAMEAARGCRTQAYYLFSYNISGHHDLKEGMSTAAPEDIVFRGGPHDLKRTWVRVVLNGASEDD